MFMRYAIRLFLESDLVRPNLVKALIVREDSRPSSFDNVGDSARGSGKFLCCAFMPPAFPVLGFQNIMEIVVFRHDLNNQNG